MDNFVMTVQTTVSTLYITEVHRRTTERKTKAYNVVDCPHLLIYVGMYEGMHIGKKVSSIVYSSYLTQPFYSK